MHRAPSVAVIVWALAACQAADIGAPLIPPRATPTPSPTKSPAPPPPPPPPPPVFAPGPPVTRRLLAREYLAVVGQLLGPEAQSQAAAPLDTALNGLDAIGAAELSVSDTGVRTYEVSARQAAAAASAGLLARYGGGCVPADKADARCLGAVVQSLGRLLYRRSLEPEEITALVGLGTAAAARLDTFEAALSWVVAAMLESPSFLYRTELGLTDLELASRMAFFLTGQGPDSALLDLAEAGTLHEPATLRAQAERLLALPSARTALSDFYDELLRLRELKSVPKNAALFPAFDAELRASMRQETLEVIRDLAFTADTDFRALFDGDTTFVDARLAGFYGLDGRFPAGFTKVALGPEHHRGGLFGQAGILAVLSHSVSTSPTLRGKFVREVLLCSAIPAPPPGVNTTLPADPPNQPRTMRQKLAAHVESNACAGCHQRMDPIGFGLERFDAIGAYRDQEQGLTIDSATRLDGVPFDGPQALGRVLRQSDGAVRCLTRSLFRQAVGRVEAPSEEPSLEEVDRRFAAAGHRMKALLVEIVLSKAFLNVSEVQ